MAPRARSIIATAVVAILAAGAAQARPKAQGPATDAQRWDAVRAHEALRQASPFHGLEWRAIGPTGQLHSYERRAEFAEVARANVEQFVGGPHPSWTLSLGDLAEVIEDEPIDRAILDMLAPWDCLEAVAGVLEPGGILCCYVATTTQMGRVMDTLRADGGFTEPTASEVMVRDWHAEGLAIRPGHATTAHTGFLVMTRRMAPGVIAPLRKRRPAPGAYGPDYVGPIPRNVRPEHLETNRTRASELG